VADDPIDAKAKENLRRLIAELEKDQAELAVEFPALKNADISEGRTAVAQALAAARRLEQALQKGSL
jgi:hypothetical protein